MSTRIASAGKFPRWMLALAAVAAIAVALALTMRVTLANDLHQFEESHNPDGISWDAPFPPDDPKDCNGVAAGVVLWHFVHTDTGLADLPSKLTADFATAGTLEADGYQNGNSIVMYNITTGHDTLLSASDDIENGGNLNLSHICVGPEQSVEESVAESAEQSVAGSQAESVPESESASAEQSVEGSAAESESASAEQSVEGSAAESESASAEQSVEGSEAESGEQSVHAGQGTPAGSVSDSSFFGAASAVLPTILFSLVLLASLGSLAYANVKAVRNRN